MGGIDRGNRAGDRGGDQLRVLQVVKVWCDAHWSVEVAVKDHVNALTREVLRHLFAGISDHHYPAEQRFGCPDERDMSRVNTRTQCDEHHALACFAEGPPIGGQLGGVGDNGCFTRSKGHSRKGTGALCVAFYRLRFCSAQRSLSAPPRRTARRRTNSTNKEAMDGSSITPYISSRKFTLSAVGWPWSGSSQ